jgi:membrane protease YdiL (CAAX protease family)
VLAHRVLGSRRGHIDLSLWAVEGLARRTNCRTGTACLRHVLESRVSLVSPARLAHRRSPPRASHADRSLNAKFSRQYGHLTRLQSAPVVDSASKRPPYSIPNAIRPATSHVPIDASVAVFAFVGAWLVAQIVSTIVLALFGNGDSVSDTPIGVLAVALIAGWTAMLAGMWVASDRAGSGHPVDDYGISFTPIDILGLGIGVLSQLVLVKVVYVPLEFFWSDTFTDDRLQQNAKELIDRAGGATTLLLFLVVALGAPVVEELFYRGLLQRPLAARFNDGLVVIGVALVFALVHFRPIEYPGLFAFGLVLGITAIRTDRLGMPILTHIGFNVTGLLLAW